MSDTRISQLLVCPTLLVAVFLCSITLLAGPSEAVDQNAKVNGKVRQPLVDPNKLCALSYDKCQNGEQWHCSRQSTPFGCGRLHCLPLPNTHC